MKTRRLGWLLLVVGSMLAVLGLLLRPNFSASASGRLAAYVSNADDAHPMTLRRTVEISFTPAYTAYLPFISNVRPTPLAGIYGQIRYQGTPVTNTEVQLQRCDNQGTYWQCSSLNRQFTTTDQSGRYQFTAAARLQNDQKYRVQFYNDDSRYLSWWWSFSIYTYTAEQAVAGGDFDVADVTLLAPDDAITATLPLNFQWVTRSTTPSDSYQVGLVNFDTDDHWYSAQLGYTGSYALTTPPPGFIAGAHYAWGVWVTSPDGGSGLSKQGRTFTVADGGMR